VARRGVVAVEGGVTMGVRASWLLARRVATGLLVAHAGGLLLLALALSVEAADEPFRRLLMLLAERIPMLWARSAPALSLLGATLAVFRLRREGAVLGLGACGVSPWIVVAIAGVLGGGVGAVAAAGEPAAAAAADGWVRGSGGWWHEGVAFPDVAGGVVGLPAKPTRSAGVDVAGGAAAGALGAALGLTGGPVGTLLTVATLLIGDGLCRGLADRSALPPAGELLPAAACLGAAGMIRLRGPLFPRRWG
jgi:hypothetical protein